MTYPYGFSRAKIGLFLLSLALILGLSLILPTQSQGRSEILWDRWGVPHIYAQDRVSLLRAFGWAQAQSHGNLILRLYGQARGRAAEYWGESFRESDVYVRTMGIPARAEQWYQTQSPLLKQSLDAFAQGINDYARQHPDQIESSWQAVLPVSGIDVLAHIHRVIHFHFLVNPQQLASLKVGNPTAGSNAWAIAPQRTQKGQAILLANPHLPWSDLYLWYEAQLVAPDLDAYGAALVGMPLLAIAFNEHLGWTIAVNPIDNADIYELTGVENGYRWEGGVKPFDRRIETLKIKQADGSLREDPLVILSSVHGPVFKREGDKSYALRVAGLDQSQVLSQFLQMAAAQNLKDFEAALSQLQLPLFNVLYADREGQILYVFNGLVPVRAGGTWADWQRIVPGNSAQTLWQQYHSYGDLPRLLNPQTGWLQNTNDPPWTSTFPPQLNAKNYPAYLAPPSLGQTNNILRPQRSLQLLQGDEKLSLETAIAKKFSSQLLLAERILDKLVPTARALANPLGLEAAEVLSRWDLNTNADSKGAVLFSLWALSLSRFGIFSTPWQADRPLTTPDGLADINTALAVLEGVAAQIKLLYGDLDVSWGEVVRMRYGKQDLPASGGPGSLGSFRVLDVVPDQDQRFRVVAGDSFIAAIAFSDPPQAKVLTVYGNASQPNSPHVGDQLPLYARSEMRPVWRTRRQVEANLEARQIF